MFLVLTFAAFGTLPDCVMAEEKSEARAEEKSEKKEKPRRRRVRRRRSGLDRRRGLRGLLRKMRRRGGGKAKVGAPAPDFELFRLQDVEGVEKDTTPEEPKQKIRLSSFVDQRPVVLIFGSYT